jgi:hypothetical protein
MPVEPTHAPIVAYDAVAQAIQARHLQTTLREAEWVGPEENPSEAGARLRGRAFDQAPVGKGGVLQGYVLTHELSQAPGQHLGRLVRRLGPAVVVSGTATVPDLIDAFIAGAPLTFVVDGHVVTGFVTPSDLNKHPARLHFYLLLADLEMALASAVRDEFKEQDAAVARLSTAAQGKVLGRLKRDRRHGVQVDLVTGMDLGHLLTIAGSSETIRPRFDAGPDNWAMWTRELVDVRNAVMHPVLTFLGPGRNVEDLSRLERGIRSILERKLP